jgi:DNA-binding NarL/FixJ family response regulator
VSRPRVLLADDHRMVAEGIKALLTDEFELVAVVEDGSAMIEAAEKLGPDVIVADIAMPKLNGFEAFARLRVSPEYQGRLFNDASECSVRAPCAGRRSFRLRGQACSPEELVLAIRVAMKGKTFITPCLTKEMMERGQNGARVGNEGAKSLTPRAGRLFS